MVTGWSVPKNMTVEQRIQERMSVTQSEANALIAFVNDVGAWGDWVATEEVESIFQGLVTRHGSHIQDLKTVLLTSSADDDDAVQNTLDRGQEWMTRAQAQWRVGVDELERSRLFEASAARRQRREQLQGGRQVLREAKNRMQMELQKMGLVEQGLRDVSTNIHNAGSLFDVYYQELRRAERAFKHMVRRANEDARYVNWAWRILLATCTYIIVKRLRILRLLQLLVQFITFAIHTMVSRWPRTESGDANAEL